MTVKCNQVVNKIFAWNVIQKRDVSNVNFQNLSLTVFAKFHAQMAIKTLVREFANLFGLLYFPKNISGGVFWLRLAYFSYLGAIILENQIGKLKMIFMKTLTNLDFTLIFIKKFLILIFLIFYFFNKFIIFKFQKNC